jgi:hypothetical protein
MQKFVCLFLDGRNHIQHIITLQRASLAEAQTAALETARGLPTATAYQLWRNNRLVCAGDFVTGAKPATPSPDNSDNCPAPMEARPRKG